MTSKHNTDLWIWTLLQKPVLDQIFEIIVLPRMECWVGRTAMMACLSEYLDPRKEFQVMPIKDSLVLTVFKSSPNKFASKCFGLFNHPAVLYLLARLFVSAKSLSLTSVLKLAPLWLENESCAILITKSSTFFFMSPKVNL